MFTEWVAHLYHEALDDAVNDVAIIVAISTVHTEVLHCLWTPVNNTRVGGHVNTAYKEKIMKSVIFMHSTFSSCVVTC